MWEKKEATGAVGYVMLFTIAIIMVIITFFMLASAKLMTIQHDVDDALADSVLASLVADDIYYFETWEGAGTAVIRFRDLDESYRLYRDCMKDAIDCLLYTSWLYHRVFRWNYCRYWNSKRLSVVHGRRPGADYS